MTPTLRRLMALGVALWLVAAFAVRQVAPKPDAPPAETSASGSTSLAALALGASGLIAHRRRRAR